VKQPPQPRKIVPVMRNVAIMLLTCCVLIANVSDSRAAVYLSNLGNRFGDQGIGDIQGVFNNWVPITVSFTTDAGSFSVNSVTLEFFMDTRDLRAPYWTNAIVRIFQQQGDERVLLGPLKNPTINPLPTEWPQPSRLFPRFYTSFVDFHPLEQMILRGFSTYVVEISDPPIAPLGLNLLSSISSNYTSIGEWHMGPTTRPVGASTSFLKLAVDADPFPGYLVPGGITALRGIGPGPGRLGVEIIQKPSDGDYTCFMFEPQGRNTFDLGYCLDEGVRAFLVPSNAPISLPTILEGNYPELKGRYAFEPEIPFYVAFYTGRAVLTNGVPAFGLGIYTNAVFGWGKFVTRDDVMEMLDSALEYGGAGIYAGTHTIISAESPVLHFASFGNQLRLSWLTSTGDFVLQQTFDLAPASWTDVTSPPTLNDATLYYEMNLRESTSAAFYRLRTK
jgi:hypothetical protein